jgi:hypothetical protein
VKAPYLLFCPLEIQGELMPKSVSVTIKQCEEAKNNLIIIDNQPHGGEKRKFGICTKQFTFKNREDTIKFVEWVEIMRILGAEKIHTFVREFHPELSRITRYYEQEGFIEAIPFKEPSGVSNARLHVRDSLFLELSVVNDCFYRVKNLYDFVAILDPDEIFLPLKESDRNWHDLLKNFEDYPKTDGYAIRSVMYPPGDGKVHDSIPGYMYMLQHTQVSF